MHAMSPVTLSALESIDRGDWQEFVAILDERAPKIERGLANLQAEPDNQALIAGVFREIHTIKSDAAMCHFDLGVSITQPLETLLVRMRDRELAFSKKLAQVMLLGMDRLALAAEAQWANRSLAHLHLDDMVRGLEMLAAEKTGAIERRATALIEAFTGAKPLPQASGASPAGRIGEDLAFFRSLALQFESRSARFTGRTGRQLRLALDTNLAAGEQVDPVQLEAAVYFHDIGMMFLPEQVWLGTGKLSDDERQIMQTHAAQAARLLAAMPGWQDAAQMVAQHHEMPYGGGYPNQLKAEAICAGAKILAIVDAFEAVSFRHGDPSQPRTILRAVSEVNACENQFAPKWITPFNAVIRHLLGP